MSEPTARRVIPSGWLAIPGGVKWSVRAPGETHSRIANGTMAVVESPLTDSRPLVD